MATLAAIQVASAQTAYWQGGNGDWGTLSNWTAFPYNGPNVVIGSSYGNPSFTTLGGTTPTGADTWGGSSIGTYEYRIKSLQSTAALIVNAPTERNHTLWIKQGGLIDNTLTIRGGIRSGEWPAADLSVTGLTTWEKGDLTGNFKFLGGLTSVSSTSYVRHINQNWEYNTAYESSVDLYGISILGGQFQFGPGGHMRNYGTTEFRGAQFGRQTSLEMPLFENYGTLNVTNSSYTESDLYNKADATINIAANQYLRVRAGALIEGTVAGKDGIIGFGDYNYSIGGVSFNGANIDVRGVSFVDGSISNGTIIKGGVSISGNLQLSQNITLDRLSAGGGGYWGDSAFNTYSNTLTVKGSTISLGTRLSGKYDFQGGFIEVDDSSFPTSFSNATIKMGGESSTHRGFYGYNAAIENTGVFTLRNASLTADGGTNTFLNSGLLTTLTGYSEVTFALQNNGELDAKGETLLGGGGSSSGRILVGRDASLSIQSKAFALTSTSILELGIDANSFGKLDIVGTSIGLNGYVSALYDPAAPIADGATFRILTGAYTGAFTASGFHWKVIYGANFVDLKYVQSVPEPSSLVFLGLGAAALLKRRKKA